jgi:hypothetical protein
VSRLCCQNILSLLYLIKPPLLLVSLYMCVYMHIHHSPTLITSKPIAWFSCYLVRNVPVKASLSPSLWAFQGYISNWQRMFSKRWDCFRCLGAVIAGK